jgi:flagellar basal body-associated protein FliL
MKSLNFKNLDKKKRQQILLIIALSFFVIAFLILYFGVWNQSANISEDNLIEEALFDEALLFDTQEATTLQLLETQIKKIDLDFEFFNETILPFLESHGDLPVKKGEVGKSNPFVP